MTFILLHICSPILCSILIYSWAVISPIHEHSTCFWLQIQNSIRIQRFLDRRCISRAHCLCMTPCWHWPGNISYCLPSGWRPLATFCVATWVPKIKCIVMSRNTKMFRNNNLSFFGYNIAKLLLYKNSQLEYSMTKSNIELFFKIHVILFLRT